MVNKVNEEVLSDEILRKRIMQLEYGGLTEWEIRQVYVEKQEKNCLEV